MVPTKVLTALEVAGGVGGVGGVVQVQVQVQVVGGKVLQAGGEGGGR